jgi:hypothetical protein
MLALEMQNQQKGHFLEGENKSIIAKVFRFIS